MPDNEQFTPSEIKSVPDFLSTALTDKQKDVANVLRTYSDDSASIYIAGCTILNTPNFPAKQSIVGHCFREMLNGIIRWNEPVNKAQFTRAIESVDFIQNCGFSSQEIDKTVNEIWDKAKKFGNEAGKLKTALIDKNPRWAQQLKDEKISPNEKEQVQRDINKIIEKVLDSKHKINKTRHFNETFYTIAPEDFTKHIETIESYILKLGQPLFEENMRVIDDILEEANAKSD